MRLEAVVLENFRSYKNRVRIPIGKLTAITGRNDVGKSTVLEALEIFFNSELVKIQPGGILKSCGSRDLMG
jgi:AAA15 family ATPase/GTPase